MSLEKIKVGGEYYVRVRVMFIDKGAGVSTLIIKEDGEAVRMPSTFFSDTEAETFIPVDELRNPQAKKPYDYCIEHSSSSDLCGWVRNYEASGWQVVNVCYIGGDTYSLIFRKEQS